MYYVYILKGKKHYVGMTHNIQRRWEEHISGRVISTKKLGALTLLGWYVHDTKEEAIQSEMKIKKSKNIKRYIGRDGFVENTTY